MKNIRLVINNNVQKKEKETEMIRKVSPELQPYYKQKVESYFEN